MYKIEFNGPEKREHKLIEYSYLFEIAILNKNKLWDVEELITVCLWKSIDF